MIFSPLNYSGGFCFVDENLGQRYNLENVFESFFRKEGIMVFNSIDFLLFFPVVVLIYFVIPQKARKYWLLIASYYFYMSWNKTYALLILASTVTTFLGGIFLNKVSKKKLVVAGTFIVNLGILFSFKYLNFLIENINFISRRLGGDAISHSLNVLLPVGISFYTFQALGYIIDVYRGDIEPEKNFVRYALFVSFFPQLVAGPIERSKNLLSQIEREDKERLFSYSKVVSGFAMMCYGMFIKVVLADNLAVFVDNVWENLQIVGFTEGLFAAVAFSLQIYCDFGAYSTIAIGAARVMGFDLMENFNTPYFATSISDFWRRWHISLSTWFKDYLYIPLGGSRCSKARKYRNIMVVFLVSGLWHGANWTYVIWGGIHGLYQIIGDALKPLREKISDILRIDREAGSYKFGRILGTFFLTTFAWIFFRADSLKDAVCFLKRMFSRFNPWSLHDGNLYNFGVNRTDFHVVVVAALVLLVVDIFRYVKKEDFGQILVRQNLIFRWIVLLALIVSTIIFGAYGIHFSTAQFIYFQF